MPKEGPGTGGARRRAVSSTGVARRKALLPAGMVAAAALTTAACTSGGAPMARAATNRTPAVTTAQARQAFDSYVRRTAAALAAGHQKAALDLTQSTQWDTLSTAFLAAASRHTAVRPYQYGTPSFFLPVQSGYPRWFLTSTRRTAPAGSPASIAGVPQARSGQVLMIFEKQGAGQPWKLASSAQLQPGQRLPKLATTAGGYVDTAPLNDSTTYLARPDVVGPLQAAVAGDGPDAPAAAAVAAGPLTTGIYASEAAVKPPAGDIRQWMLEGSNYGRFALRTADGGALTFYAMYLNATTEVPAELAKSDNVSPGRPIAIPRVFRPLLKPGTSSPRERLITQYSLAFAAVDPPASAPKAKIQVIAMGGAPSWASGS